MIGSTQRRQRFRARRLGALVVGIALGLAGTASAQSGPYTITKILYPGSTDTNATGISNSGLIVGIYHDTAGVVHSFTFDGTTYANADYPGSGANYGMGISRDGKVLGTYALTADGTYHATVLDSGTFTAFDYPGMDTDARAMNATGNIVGVFNAGGLTTPHGFLRNGSGNFTVLDVPGYPSGTEVWGINDAGVITGYGYDSALNPHAFLYSNGAYTTINFPGASSTGLTHINNLNQAVGWYYLGGKAFGLVYTGNSYRTLTVDGATATFGFDINDSGKIVGHYFSTDCPSGCGFLAVPKAGTPVCDQRLTLNYGSNTLTMGFTITSAGPMTWTTLLYLSNTLVQLWSTPIPAIATPSTVSVPIAGFPKVGNVIMLSALSSPTSGILCADLASVNTGP